VAYKNYLLLFTFENWNLEFENYHPIFYFRLTTFYYFEFMIVKTPPPPYYAVIFTNTRTDGDDGYATMAEKMDALAKEQPGYLGVESVRDGLGVTVSYWESLEAIKNWKANLEHLEAQNAGREKWYSAYKTRICKVERDYEFP